MKRILALLLVLALAPGLSGCGETEVSTFRILEVAGTRRYSLVYRKDDRIAPVLDAAMRALAADGSLAAISIRWLGRNAITLEGALPEETEAPEEGAEATETTRTLFVGVEQNFDPMAFEENGALKGMSIDIAQALARALDWELSYQPISPSEVGTQLSSGNIDCALGFDPDTVSAGKYTVGVCYMESEVVLAARPDGNVRTLRDINGQRIGTIDDPVVTGLVRTDEKIVRYASGATVYLSPQRCINALDSGWCAAVAMDRIMLEHLR